MPSSTGAAAPTTANLPGPKCQTRRRRVANACGVPKGDGLAGPIQAVSPSAKVTTLDAQGQLDWHETFYIGCIQLQVSVEEDDQP